MGLSGTALRVKFSRNKSFSNPCCWAAVSSCGSATMKRRASLESTRFSSLSMALQSVARPRKCSGAPFSNHTHDATMSLSFRA